MPFADGTFGWNEAAAAYAVVLVASFLVTRVVTDLMRVPRAVYVAVLAVTALTLGAFYLVRSGTSITELVASGWGWGLVAGLIAAAIAVPLVRRLPLHPHREGVPLAASLLWEGLVYGIAEAIVLATLPVLALWHAATAAGWTDGGWGKAGAGATAIVGSLLVILVHHLGYAEFRTAASRPKLGGALVTCGLQALAFLLTGNVLAPVVAHIALHGQMIFRGVELPPASATVVDVPRFAPPSERPMPRFDRVASG